MKKYFKYILILIAIVSVFSVSPKAYAGEVDPQGTCTITTTENGKTYTQKIQTTYTYCQLAKKSEKITVSWVADGGSSKYETDASAFEKAINDGCSMGVLSSVTVPGCLLRLMYYGIYMPVTFLLMAGAMIFNYLINLTLNSDIYDAKYVKAAWVIVRDISNVFFILILIYVGIKTILGMGGHETKSTVASVVMMAILINFSLFFTRVVIDSSNIVALVFYDKLDTTYKDKTTGNPVERKQELGEGVQDLSGALWSKFDMTQLLNKEFIDKLKTVEVKTSDGKVVQQENASLPFMVTFSILLVAATVMIYASYLFFSSGFYFVARIIDLWIVMIFAPFAFMSFAVPQLAHMETIGWSDWLKKLTSSSFMVSMFMFFLYIIFKLLEGVNSIVIANNDGFWMTLIKLLIPALLILGMLKKAQEHAKKASGQFGDMIMNGVQNAVGIAVGGALGFAAKGLVGWLGNNAAKTANNAELRKQATEGTPEQQAAARKRLESANKWANYSFDVRQTGLGKMFSSKTGINLDRGKMMGLDSGSFKNGRMGQIKHEQEHLSKKLKTYMLTTEEANQMNAEADMAKKLIKSENKLIDAQNKRADAYEKDLEEHRKASEKYGISFNETGFKQAYMNGGNLSEFGVEKTVQGGSVERREKIDDSEIITADQVNKQRREKYLTRIQNHHPTTASSIKDMLHDAASAIKSDAKITMPIGLAFAPSTGGMSLLAAAGAAAATGAGRTFLASFKHALGVHENDRQVIAEMRRTKSDAEKSAETIAEKLKQGGDSDHGAKKEKPAGGDNHGDAH